MLDIISAYAVLVVSSSERFNATLATFLPEGTFSPMTVARSVNAAKRLLLDKEFDLVLINEPLPDDRGIKFASDVAIDTAAGVILVARTELCNELSDQMAAQGVAMLPKPASSREVELALQFSRAAHARLVNAAKKQVSVEEKIAEIRLVNKAKWLLIGELGMSEPDAHRFIEKRAMNSRIPKREVAQDIIDQYGD